MAEVKIDLSNLEYIAVKSREIFGKMENSLHDYRSLHGRVNEECVSVIADLTQKIEYLRLRLGALRRKDIEINSRLVEAQAQSQKRRGDLSYSGNIDTRQAFQHKENISAVSSAVYTLERCVERLSACRDSVTSKHSMFEQKSANTASKLGRTSDGMGRFCAAMRDSITAAASVLSCRMSASCGGMEAVRKLSIDTSGHHSYQSNETIFSGYESLSAESVEPEMTESAKSEIIKSSIADDVFARISGFDSGDILKIPSARYHKLGANVFAERLNDMGFELIKHDGYIIDSDGFISWRKR